MIIESGKVVSISYELKVKGEKVDSASEEAPLQYIHGKGMLLPKFEKELEGKGPEESFSFTLTPEEGYGLVSEEMIIPLPKEAFMIDGILREDLLVEGQVIPMQNQDGAIVQGTIKEITTDKVIMDFNHPMAGKTLSFTGKVIEVRDASEDELKNGLSRRCHKGKGKCKKGEGHCREEGHECCEEGECDCNKGE